MHSAHHLQGFWNSTANRAILYKSKQCNENFKKILPDFFVTKLHNMGTVGLLWTPGIKMGHFELTQDHLDPEDPKGMRRSLCLFCSKPLQYGCLWTPLDPSSQDLAIWPDSGPPEPRGHRGYVKVTLPFLFQTPTIWVSMDSHWTPAMISEVIRTLEAKFWAQGPFGP